MDHAERIVKKMVFNTKHAFNEPFYCSQFPSNEVKPAQPLEHYIEKGWREGKSPHRWFDAAWYLQNNPDVAASDIEPLTHYLLFGWLEGRHPHPEFDNIEYCFRHPQIIRQRISPLQHVIENPAEEATIRPTTPQAAALGEDKWPSFLPNMEAFPHASPKGQEAQVAAYRAARKTNNRVAVITAITKNYDTLRLPAHLSPEIDYFVYTDDPQLCGLGIYNVRVIKTLLVKKPHLLSRLVKFHPHLLLGRYDVVIWADANVVIRKDIMPYAEAFRDSKQSLAFLDHPLRNCAYAEARVCVEMQKESLPLATQQVARLRAQGFPENRGLIESNLFACRPAMNDSKRFFRTWSTEFDKGSSRDQLSINYALWKCGLSYFPFLGHGFNTRNHPATVLMNHGHGDAECFSQLRQTWKPEHPAMSATLPFLVSSKRVLAIIRKALNPSQAEPSDDNSRAPQIP